MENRIALKKNDILPFPGLTCIVDAPAGRGGSVLAYTGHYADSLDPSIRHRVLIRELFPFDPSGKITRLRNGDLAVEESSRPQYDRHRERFLRSNQVHSRMAEELPADMDLHINTFSLHNTLYSVLACNGGRTLAEEMPFYTAAESADTELTAAIRIIRGVLEELDAFHEAGYLHLDISPENILLIGEGPHSRVLLIDYDFVHTEEEIHGRGKDTAPVFGIKEGYTAPEVRLGQLDYIGPPSDLYSAASVFWECLSGSRLTAMQQAGHPLPDPALLERWKSLPGTVLSLLRRIVQKGLAPSPLRRYANTAQMLADLRELEERIRGRGITHWALWESGRARCLRMIRDNAGYQYVTDQEKMFPMHAENEKGRRAELFSVLNTAGFTEPEKPLLLLGSGGMGKSTALYRLAWRSYAGRRLYQEGDTAVFYISLYNYRHDSDHFIRDTLLEGLRFKEETENLADARRELEQLLDDNGKDTGFISQGTQETSIFQAPRILLLLDGFNEAAGDTAALLQEIRFLTRKRGVRIILSSRSDPGDPLFRRWTLVRLDHSEVRAVLSKEGILPPENMEIFDLLGFPILLSLYMEAVKNGEADPSDLQGSEDLLDTYFSSLCRKERENLSGGAGPAAGVDAVFQYLLPEIAAFIRQKGCAVPDSELITVVEKCYRELSGRAVTAVFPEWIGHTAELRLDAADADAWYGQAVLRILHARTGLLVRDEEGRIRIVHQILEEYLADKSRAFHRLYDREKRRQKLTRRTAAAAVILALVLAFGFYNARMRSRISQKNAQMIRSETEQAILEDVDRSEKALEEGKEEEAVEAAGEAVLLAYMDFGQAERVLLEEDGIELLREDLPVILERIENEQSADRISENRSLLFFDSDIDAVDSYYTSLSQKALTDALHVYDPEKMIPLLQYDPSWAHAQAGISADRKRVMLFSSRGFQVYNASTAAMLCEIMFDDPEMIDRVDFIKDGEGSRLEVNRKDGSRTLYDAEDGKQLPAQTDPEMSEGSDREFIVNSYRLVLDEDGLLTIYDRETGEDEGVLEIEGGISRVRQAGEYLLIENDADDAADRCAWLFNDSFELLAELPGCTDLVDTELFFDDGQGRISSCSVYTLSDLMDIACK